jgi:predicted nucleic acid-binding protein
MTLYVDSSAFVKRHSPTESMHAECNAIMVEHDFWITSRITAIEGPRGLARTSPSNPAAIASFDEDALETAFIDVDHGVVSLARAIALETGVKTLDAIHIASAKQVPDGELEFLTYDDRQAAAAERLGLRLAR